MFAQVAVSAAIAWDRHADARRHQPMWLACGVLRNDREDDFTWREKFQSLRSRDDLAVRWKDGRNPNQVLCRDSGIAQCQFERRQPLFMFSHSLGEKNALRDHVFAQFLRSSRKKYQECQTDLLRFMKSKGKPISCAMGNCVFHRIFSVGTKRENRGATPTSHSSAEQKERIADSLTSLRSQ